MATGNLLRGKTMALAVEHTIAHVAWWALHTCILTALCILPSDLVVGENVLAHRWLVALALGVTVLTHYAVRFSNPGWAGSPGSANGHRDDCESALLTAEPTAAADIEPSKPPLCPECGRLRRHPATVHCRYCDRCVEGFDHHCTWLGVCVGARNHHLFARYCAVQAVVAFMGFHYALTACGRHSAYGNTWSYGVLALMGLLLLPLSFLTLAHVFLVLTGQTSRQVMNRFRVVGSGAPRQRAREPGATAEQLPHLTAGLMLQNCTALLCGVRPGWLLHSAWVQRAGGWVWRLVHNRYYSCC